MFVLLCSDGAFYQTIVNLFSAVHALQRLLLSKLFRMSQLSFFNVTDNISTKLFGRLIDTRVYKLFYNALA